MVQRARNLLTRADLIKYLGRVLLRTGMEPAAALLEDLADRHSHPFGPPARSARSAAAVMFWSMPPNTTL